MSITLDDITDLQLDGNGSFDKLMRAVSLHIEHAIGSNQITQEQAGAIYTNVIPSIIHEATNFELQKDLVTQQILAEEAKAKQADIEYRFSYSKYDAESKIYNDADYPVDKLRVLKAEADTAEYTAKDAFNKSGISAEQLTEAKERNGLIGYKVVYKYKYYDWKNDKHNIDPVYDMTVGKYVKPKDYVDETIIFQVYMNGIGEWIVLDTNETTSVDIPMYNLMYKDYEDINKDSEISVLYSNDAGDYVLSHKEFIGSTNIVFTDVNGAVYIIPYNDSTKDTYIKNNTSSIIDGLVLNDDGTIKTIAELDEIKDDFDNTDTDTPTDVINVSVCQITAEENNTILTTTSLPGYNPGIDETNDYNKPPSDRKFVYSVSEDLTEVYKKIASYDTNDVIAAKSLVELQKEESSIKIEELELNKSKLESEVRVVTDEQYVNSVLKAGTTEGDIAEKNLLKATLETDLLNEQLAEQKELNGNIAYNYIYAYKYYDYRNVKINVNPIQDNNGNWVPPYNDKTEEVVFTGYMNVDGKIESSGSTEIIVVNLTDKHYSYRQIDGNIVDTNVPTVEYTPDNYVDYTGFEGRECYIITDTMGRTTVFDANDYSNKRLAGDTVQSIIDIYNDVCDTDDVTELARIEELYQAFINDDEEDCNNDISVFGKYTLFGNTMNKYNKNVQVLSKDTEPYIVKKIYSYRLELDPTVVYTKEQTSTGIDDESSKSMAYLKKLELTKKLDLSKRQLDINSIR